MLYKHFGNRIASKDYPFLKKWQILQPYYPVCIPQRYSFDAQDVLGCFSDVSYHLSRRLGCSLGWTL